MGYYSSERRELLPHLPDNLGAVLELGCGEGRHGGLLLSNGMASSVVGVDLHAPSDDAKNLLTSFIRADLSDWLRKTKERFDTVLALDVLEHIENPWEAVELCFNVLRPGGQFISSIPNVRFIKVSANLLIRGRFDYCEQGILDRTHLRFFTRRSIVNLFSDAGFVDVDIQRLRYPQQTAITRLGAVLLRDLGCKQFVITASKPKAPTNSINGKADES